MGKKANPWIITLVGGLTATVVGGLAGAYVRWGYQPLPADGGISQPVAPPAPVAQQQVQSAPPQGQPQPTLAPGPGSQPPSGSSPQDQAQLDRQLLDVLAQAQFHEGPGGEGDVEIVRSLLAQGANPSARGPQVTALMWAVSKDRADLLKLLLEAGADVNGRHAESNSTALHAAASFGLDGSVALLLSWGAHVNARDQWGHTPLHNAANGGHTGTVKTLVANGAEVDVRAATNDGETPLLVAAMRCDCPDTVRALIDAGADVQFRNRQEYTPLHFAAQQGLTRNAAVLLYAGAEVNARASSLATPLIEAAAFGHTETARLLLEYEADVTAKNAWGRTALDFALEREYTDMESLLRQAGALN